VKRGAEIDWCLTFVGADRGRVGIVFGQVYMVNIEECMSAPRKKGGLIYGRTNALGIGTQEDWGQAFAWSDSSTLHGRLIVIE